MVFELWKNQKNPNGIKIWPDWAKLLFIFLYGTPKLMDFDEKNIIHQNLCSPVFFTPSIFLNDSGICIPFHITNMFPTSWKFLTPSENLLLFFSDPPCYELWLMNFHKVPNFLFKKRGQIGIRALIESNIFHTVSKL